MKRSLLLRTALAAALLAAFGLPRGTVAQSADDQSLFSTVVPPNVLLLVDNSGSMNHVVWHPEFDPTVSPSCSFWSDTTTYFVHSSISGDSPSGAGDTFFSPGTYDRCGNEREIFVDDQVDAAPDYTRWSGRYLNWYFSDAADAYANAIAAQSGEGTEARSTCLFGSNSPFSSTFSSDIDTYRRARVTAEKDILLEVICEVNASGEVRFGLAQFRRPNFVDLNGDGSNSAGEYDANGGYVRVPIDQLKQDDGSPNSYTLNGVTQTHGDHLEDAIDDLTGESQTPLAESLFQSYTYYMSHDSSDTRPEGVTGRDFPIYDYSTDPSEGFGGPEADSDSEVPQQPVEWPCQRHFVIVITDGEPTYDDFDVHDPSETAEDFDHFADLIGDYNSDGETEELGNFHETTRYLDDIAKFMQENDFRPEMAAHNGQEQVIDTYTVGFTTTPAANAILEKTAEVGNGEFFYSTEPDKLAADIVAAVTDIVQKAQAFTAATVPATRTSFGGKLYTSLFVPSSSSGYWEGHLLSWDLTGTGEIRDKNGDCALDDPDTGECFDGSFKPLCAESGANVNCVEPFWDAGRELTDSNSPSNRSLSTSRVNASGNPVKVSFDTSTIAAADLNVSGSEISEYQYNGNPAPATDEELADMLVQNVRGCVLGTGVNSIDCEERDWLLGDIFHSNPLVIPGPAGFVDEPSFRDFLNNHRERDRVIVAGANDGFLHFFHAGDWDSTLNPERHDAGTGEEIAGFMPYPARQNAKELPTDTDGRSFYYVDGPPAAADVWFYDSPTQAGSKTAAQWRTVLLGGLRQGGSALYALDITESGTASTSGGERPSCTPIPGTSTPSASDQYPCYLWEFPRENAPSSITEYMGDTWSEPVVTRVRVSVDGDACGGNGCERWVAVFGGGYHPSSDPNDHSNYDVLSKKGRALVMLDLKTGEVLGLKKFDDTPTTSSTDPSSAPWDPAATEESMFFGFAARPGVFDIDFDGYADVIYIGDLGGNLWKWVVKDVGVDPVNGSGSVDQPNWKFGKHFEAPVYDDGSNTYWKSFYASPSATLRNGTLWLAQGSGERNKLTFEGFSSTDVENNRFYAIKDPSPLLLSQNPFDGLEESDLLDITGRSDQTCANVSSYDGFFFRGVDGEKFVTESDIFFFFTFVASFTPDSGASRCESGGSSKLYSFKIHCGEGLFEDDSTGEKELSVDLGAGLPTDPRITISSEGSDESNRVIINKQVGGASSGDGSGTLGGEIKNRPTGTGFGPGVGQFYWRELRN